MEVEDSIIDKTNIETPKEPAAGAEEIATSAEPTEAAPKKTTRELLKDAFKEAREKEEKVIKVKEHERKVVAKPQAKEEDATAQKQETKAPEVKPLDAPISWRAPIKAKWNELPREVQEEVLRREQETQKKISEVDEERHYGRKIKDVVNPYMPLFNMSNQSVEGGIKEMLNYAQILQMGNPQQKGQLLWQLAQRWNADMKFTPQVATQPQHQLVSLQTELQKTKDELARLPQTLKQQQEAEQAKQIIEAFANDPKNVHYEKVKPAMAALLQQGIAKDMQDAYDRACFADPEIRPLLLAEKEQAEAKRIADEKQAKAVKARNIASSVKGSGGLNGAQPVIQPKRSLREELVANFRAATSH